MGGYLHALAHTECNIKNNVLFFSFGLTKLSFDWSKRYILGSKDFFDCKEVTLHFPIFYHTNSCLFVLMLFVQVNIYGHAGMVSSPNHIFSWQA